MESSAPRAAAPPVVEREPEPVPVEPAPVEREPEPQTQCPKHPGVAVAGACKRCGTFYCATCEPEASGATGHTCAACRVVLAPEQIKKVLNEFLISSILIAALLAGAPAILMLTLGTNTRAVGFLVIGGFAAAVIFGAGVLLRATGHPVFAWGLFVIELLSFGSLLLISPSMISGALLAAIASFSLRSATKLSGLRALAAARTAVR